MNSLFIGRYQPFHGGHQKLINKVLNEGKSVVVAVRDTEISEENPYTYKQRKDMIENVYGGRVKIIKMPDIDEVCYGRNVGYGLRKIRLDKQTEEVSATKLRDSQKRVIWFTGNMGSGKTSLAYLLKERLNGIVLDGDEMRASISLGAGFSKEQREEHNLRVARLASVLHAQGHNVIVAVIAPFRSTREKIDAVCNPYWIHIKGGAIGLDKPYEVPEKPDIVIDPSIESLLESIEKIVKGVGKIK
jgi:cytidyltransferase-like protein